MIFSERLEYEKLREVIETRFLKYRRFTSGLSRRPLGAFWESDSLFRYRPACPAHCAAGPGRQG
ncbi:MAG: hypothetical protein MZV65_49065 [Chromatiales bacterium]|nr:hypothetical protein [Chromatiales bacterium]